MTELDRFVNERRMMVEVHLRRRDIVDPEVLSVMGRVRRECFVPEEYRHQTYCDSPLSIGHDQTISQPYIVALMTQELRVDDACEVLEIGTGCGYQTAVLCALAKRVYTVERIAELSVRACGTLGGIGVENVEFYVGDGSAGWPKEKVFDRIMITAAIPSLPGVIVDQLAEGGLIVAPVGMGEVQELIVGQKRDGRIVERHVCGCRFVKLIGEFGFSE